VRAFHTLASMSTPRLQPRSPEAEVHVLGGILIDNAAYDEVADRLAPDDFYEARHRIIYETIRELRDRERSADVLSLYDRLREKGRLEDVGGAEYLAELEESVPSAAYVEPHARIVREKAIMRRMIRTCAEIVEEAYADVDDVDTFIDDAEQRVFSVREAAEADLGEGLEPVRPLLKRTMAQLEARMKDKREVTGVPTGFIDLDRKTAGLQPGDLIILAARPSMGKTSLGLNIALNAAQAQESPEPVAIFSLEMSREPVAMRLLATEARVAFNKLQTGFFGEDDVTRLVRAMDEISRARLAIDDTPGMTVGQVRSRCRRLKAREGLGLVVVDYLQLMNPPPSRRKSESREREISEISRGLKALAKQLNVPVLALSQLNREIEKRKDKRPMLSDLRESGSIEQDADVIMFIHREERYQDNTDKRGVAEVIVAKQRNGPVGTVELKFWSEHMRFENLAKRTDGVDWG